MSPNHVDLNIIERMRDALPLLATLDEVQESVSWGLGGHRDFPRQAYGEGHAWLALLNRMRHVFPENAAALEAIWKELAPCRLVTHGE